MELERKGTGGGSVQLFAGTGKKGLFAIRNLYLNYLTLF